MLSSQEALEETIAENNHFYGDVNMAIHRSIKKGKRETTVDCGIYKKETVENVIEVLSMKGYDLHLKNNFCEIHISW